MTDHPGRPSRWDKVAAAATAAAALITAVAGLVTALNGWGGS